MPWQHRDASDAGPAAPLRLSRCGRWQKKKKKTQKMAFASAAGAKGSVPGELQALAARGREAAGFPLAELAAKLGSRG